MVRLKNESKRVNEIYPVLPASLSAKLMQTLWRPGGHPAQVISLRENGKPHLDFPRHLASVSSFKLLDRIKYLLVLAPPERNFQIPPKSFRQK